MPAIQDGTFRLRKGTWHLEHGTRKGCHYYTTLGVPLTAYSSDRACPCHVHLSLPCPPRGARSKEMRCIRCFKFHCVKEVVYAIILSSFMVLIR